MTSIMGRDLTQEEWALSGLLFGLDRVIDADGRPIAERRAPSMVKDSVPMELRDCPYHDERKGQPMNVSALAQLTKHLTGALEDVAAFQRHPRATPGTWDGMFAAVIDQLAGPALHVLREGSSEVRVPSRVSVGHKLAAGFFDVMQRLLREHALGRAPAVGLDEFLAYVCRERALIGASEVCAGPPNLISRSAQVFLFGASSDGEPVDDDRWQIAHLLCTQMKVGVAWTLFDRSVERRVFFGDESSDAFAPRNRFIRERFDAGRAESRKFVGAEGVDPIVAALPDRIGEDERRSLQEKMEPAFREDGDETAASQAIEGLLREGDGAILVGPQRARGVTRAMGAYLQVHRSFAELIRSLEHEIRVRLDYPTDTPVRLGGLIFPRPRALPWFEAVVGHQLRGTSEGETLRLANHHRSLELTPLFRGPA